MMIKDVDEKLDMRLHLRLRQDTELFKATSDMDMTFPVFISNWEKTVWMSTYFPKLDRNPKIELINRKFKSVELEDSYVVDSRINNISDLEIIGKLIEVPSFIVNRADMSKGFLNIYARFHNSRLREVSDLLAEYTLDSKNSRINWLGPSMGIISILELINSTYPLSVVSYRIPSDGQNDGISKVMKDTELIAEVRNNLTRDGKVSSILYTDHGFNNKQIGLLPISEKDGIYQLEVPYSFANLVREKANKLHILRTRYFIKSNGDSLEFIVFLPSNNVYEYYTMLYEIARENRHGIMVSALMPYSPSIWEYF